MFLSAQNDAMLITAIFEALGNFFAKIIGSNGCGRVRDVDMAVEMLAQANQEPQ